MILRAVLALALFVSPAAAQQQAPAVDPTTGLVLRLEEAAAQGDREGILTLAASRDVPGILAFVSIVTPAPTRLIIKERDRSTLASGEELLLLEVLAEFDREGVITTWRAHVAQDTSDGDARRITHLERLTVVSGLHRLALNPGTQFDVNNLTLKGVDLTLQLPSGSAFVAETLDGPTAVVLLGRGRMQFAPSDPAERTQIRIFSGKPVLTTDFDAAFLRVRPSEFDQLFGTAFAATRVTPSLLRRATDVFEEYVAQTYQIDLTDLSRERWTLIPGPGDLVVEVRTRRMGSLTYTRSTKDAEDVSLFDRRRRRNISIYASPEKLAARGRFYSEDDLAEYDVLDYDVSATFSPDRLWVDGTARLTLKVRAYALASLSLRLAEPLVIRNVVSPELGRLLHLRVVGQNSVIINLPASVPHNDEIVLVITYSGRLEPQQIDRESITVADQEVREIYIPIEPQWLYSNRSYWYPQAMVTDYATAAVRITVPADYEVVATGISEGPAVPIEATSGSRALKQFTFTADEPSRYLAVAISRFIHVSSSQIAIPVARGHHLTQSRSATRGPATSAAADGAADHADDDLARQTVDLALNVHSNPRQVGRARPMAERGRDIIQFYARLIGDAPYPSFTLAVTENELPGGHSPAYFALLNEPSPLTPFVWRNDPVAFDGYPSFFLAHEIAHQWWGQAVGWKNYHEQWLSEGFAQYFAVMYAAHDRGEDLQHSIQRQMRRWAMEQSAQGPVYLGYRLGHIRSDGRVFRALVYNKGAMVLHMLRRLVGDEAFFAGLRQYYNEWKFDKAGTDDLRQAMERVSGMDLAAFFEGWIYGSAVPSLRFSSEVRGSDVVLRLEHRREIIPTPVTVALNYANGHTEQIVVAATDRVTERVVPLSGSLRSVDVNRDHGAVADIGRN